MHTSASNPPRSPTAKNCGTVNWSAQFLVATRGRKVDCLASYTDQTCCSISSIGKTTLLDAWLARLAGEAPLWLGHGQCSEAYGLEEPYQPVLEALGRLGQS